MFRNFKTSAFIADAIQVVLIAAVVAVPVLWLSTPSRPAGVLVEQVDDSASVEADLQKFASFSVLHVTPDEAAAIDAKFTAVELPNGKPVTWIGKHRKFISDFCDRMNNRMMDAQTVLTFVDANMALTGESPSRFLPLVYVDNQPLGVFLPMSDSTFVKLTAWVSANEAGDYRAFLMVTSDNTPYYVRYSKARGLYETTGHSKVLPPLPEKAVPRKLKDDKKVRDIIKAMQALEDGQVVETTR